MEIRFFPEKVYRESPSLRDDRYIDHNNRTYVMSRANGRSPPGHLSSWHCLVGGRSSADRSGLNGTKEIFKNRRFCPEPDIVEIISFDGVLFGLLVPDRCSSNAAAQRSFN